MPKQFSMKANITIYRCMACHEHVFRAKLSKSRLHLWFEWMLIITLERKNRLSLQFGINRFMKFIS